MSTFFTHAISDSTGCWGIRVLSKSEQELTKSFLPRTACSAFNTLPRDVNEFGDSLPASSSCGSILAVRKKLIGFRTGLSPGLISSVTVGYIKIINIFLCFLYGSSFLLCGGLCTASKVCVSSFTPFPVAIDIGWVKAIKGVVSEDGYQRVLLK